MRTKSNNPFDPNVNRPKYLGGRGKEIKAISQRIDEGAAGSGKRAFGFYGYPGVGKTAILETLASRVPANWATNKTAPLCPEHDDFRPALWEAIGEILRTNKDLARDEWGKKLVRVIKSANLTVTLDLLGVLGVSADLGQEAPPTSHYEEIETALVTLAESAQQHNKAVLLCLDEVQNVSPEGKTALIYAMEKIQNRGLPLLLAVAGLPPMLDGLIGAKKGITRTWGLSEIGLLSVDGCREILVRSADIYHEEFEDDALDLLASAADHAPFMVQTYGHICWTANPHHPRMTLDDARAAIKEGNAEVDRAGGTFDLLLRGLRTGRLDYLTSMASARGDGIGVRGRDIDAEYQRRRGSRPDGRIRQDLLDRGLVFQPDGQRGYLAFAIPGLRSHIARRADSDG